MGGAVLPSAQVAELARAAGFDLVGFARAAPIPPAVLGDWLAAGHHADLDWMAERVAERLDVTRLLPGARTVVALACNYWRTDEASPIARYARGRDYHATLKDRMRALRRAVRARWPHVQDYGSVDANPVMEKVWAARAGLGFVGKNACFITPEFGSWVVLAAFVLDAEVDGHGDGPQADRCLDCTLCLTSCPTDALVAPRTVDARRCLSFHTIEHQGPVPAELRAALEAHAFGCDDCQSVCPLNALPVLAGERFSPRPVGSASVQALAAMTPEQYQAWVPGTALARAGYDGLRRNAAYALGAGKVEAARATLMALAVDPAPGVCEAAQWALAQLDG